MTHPNDAAFANNAADLVEFRLRRVADATAIRVTVNSLHPTATAFVIAIGDSAQPILWPFRSGVVSPRRLVPHRPRHRAVLSEARTGSAVSPSPTVALNHVAKQFDVRVPHSAWNPGRSTVRFAAGTGLWNPASGTLGERGSGSLVVTPGSRGPDGDYTDAREAETFDVWGDVARHYRVEQVRC